MARILTTLLRPLSEADPTAASNLVDFEEREAGPSRYAVTQNIHPASEEADDAEAMAPPYDGAPLPGGPEGAMPPEAAPGGAPPDGQLQDMNSVPPEGAPPVQESSLYERGFDLPGLISQIGGGGGMPGMGGGGRGRVNPFAGLLQRAVQGNTQMRPQGGGQGFPGNFGDFVGAGRSAGQGSGPGGSGYLPPGSPQRQQQSQGPQYNPRHAPVGRGEYTGSTADLNRTQGGSLMPPNAERPSPNPAARASGGAAAGGAAGGAAAGLINRDDGDGYVNPTPGAPAPAATPVAGGHRPAVTTEHPYAGAKPAPAAAAPAAKNPNDPFVKYGDPFSWSGKYNYLQDKPQHKWIRNNIPIIGAPVSALGSGYMATAGWLQDLGQDKPKPGAPAPVATAPAATPEPVPAAATPPAQPPIQRDEAVHTVRDGFDIFLDEIFHFNEEGTEDLNRQQLAGGGGASPSMAAPAIGGGGMADNALRSYGGFDGPQQAPASIAQGGPAAIKNWQSQMSAISGGAPNQARASGGQGDSRERNAIPPVGPVAPSTTGDNFAGDGHDNPASPHTTRDNFVGDGHDNPITAPNPNRRVTVPVATPPTIAAPNPNRRVTVPAATPPTAPPIGGTMLSGLPKPSGVVGKPNPAAPIRPAPVAGQLATGLAPPKTATPQLGGNPIRLNASKEWKMTWDDFMILSESDNKRS